jgi:hypothetical protein
MFLNFMIGYLWISQIGNDVGEKMGYKTFSDGRNKEHGEGKGKNLFPANLHSDDSYRNHDMEHGWEVAETAASGDNDELRIMRGSERGTRIMHIHGDGNGRIISQTSYT